MRSIPLQHDIVLQHYPVIIRVSNLLSVFFQNNETNWTFQPWTYIIKSILKYNYLCSIERSFIYKLEMQHVFSIDHSIHWSGSIMATSFWMKLLGRDVCSPLLNALPSAQGLPAGFQGDTRKTECAMISGIPVRLSVRWVLSGETAGLHSSLSSSL